MNDQVKSKKRVADFGEVFTSPEIVNAMLDLVKQETERIDSRFLEPACGTGNFLIEILKRKISIVEKKYGASQQDYERYIVIAVSSIYGIDILEDNVIACRERLFEKVEDSYKRRFADKIKTETLDSIRYILSRNIIWGDALTLQTVEKLSKPILFSEWSPINGNLLKRRDYSFRELVEQSSMRELPLFSDMDEKVFIPTPVADYPPVHYLMVGEFYAR